MSASTDRTSTAVPFGDADARLAAEHGQLRRDSLGFIGVAFFVIAAAAPMAAFVGAGPVLFSIIGPGVPLHHRRLGGLTRAHRTEPAMTDTTASAIRPSGDYVPVEEWPAVTAMVEGFGDPSLPASSALDGRTIDIAFENGWTIAHEFRPGELTWTITEGQGTGMADSHPARIVEARPGIFFIDFVKGEGAHAHDVSMVLELESGRVTVAESSFENRDGAVRMRTDLLPGRIQGTGEILAPERTDRLSGLRVYYRYSAEEHYEHIYLDEGTFVWRCVRGAERGLADADPIRVYAIAEDLVALHWSETVMPVESFLLIDLAEQRSIGRMFCWDGPTLAPLHLPFDSRLTVLGETTYPVD